MYFFGLFHKLQYWFGATWGWVNDDRIYFLGKLILQGSVPLVWDLYCFLCASAPTEPYKQAGEGHEEETDGVFSEDEASVQKGLRRSQSVKLARSKAARKEVHVHMQTFNVQLYHNVKQNIKYKHFPGGLRLSDPTVVLPEN